MTMNTNTSSLAGLIWSVADLLRGDFKQSQYGRIILPFTVLRRLECVLAPTKEKLLAVAQTNTTMPEQARHKLLLNAAGQSFYNTSKLDMSKLGETHIHDNLDSYVWILSNRKLKERKEQVLLINATDLHSPMRKLLGSKRKFLNDEALEKIVGLYSRFDRAKLEASGMAKIFKTTTFGYRRTTVERPLKLAFYPQDAERLTALQADKGWNRLADELQQRILDALGRFSDEKLLSRATFKKQLTAFLGDTKLPAAPFKLLCKHIGEQNDEAEVCTAKGKPEANSDLRDNENVPLGEDIRDYFTREVLPHVPDAWIDEGKCDDKDVQVGIVGYEIPFNRHFYQYQPPRSLEEIDADLDAVSREIMKLLAGVHS